jgi:hypothetical protein
MTAMTRPEKRNWRITRAESTVDPRPMLDVLLALDRMVVEVSMHLYNVDHRDRSNIRGSNRRLHAAVRQHLPRLLKHST